MCNSLYTALLLSSICIRPLVGTPSLANNLDKTPCPPLLMHAAHTVAAIPRATRALLSRTLLEESVSLTTCVSHANQANGRHFHHQQ